MEGPTGFPPKFPGLSKEDNQMAIQYISHADETECLAHILRMHQSIANGLTKAVVKSLLIMTDFNKGKGHVLGFKEEENSAKRLNTQEVIRFTLHQIKSAHQSMIQISLLTIVLVLLSQLKARLFFSWESHQNPNLPVAFLGKIRSVGDILLGRGNHNNPQLIVVTLVIRLKKYPPKIIVLSVKSEAIVLVQ